MISAPVTRTDFELTVSFAFHRASLPPLLGPFRIAVGEMEDKMQMSRAVFVLNHRQFIINGHDE